MGDSQDRSSKTPHRSGVFPPFVGPRPGSAPGAPQRPAIVERRPAPMFTRRPEPARPAPVGSSPLTPPERTLPPATPPVVPDAPTRPEAAAAPAELLTPQPSSPDAQRTPLQSATSPSEAARGPEIDDFVIEREEAIIDLPNPTPPAGQDAATEDAYQHIAYEEANSGLTAHTPSGSHASVDGLIIENTELSFDGATLSAPGLELWGSTATDELFALDAAPPSPPAAPMQDVLAEIESLVAEATSPVPASAESPRSEPAALTPWVEEDLTPTPAAASFSAPPVVEVVAVRAVADEASTPSGQPTLDELKVHEPWGSTPAGGVWFAAAADASSVVQATIDDATAIVVAPVVPMVGILPVVAEAGPSVHASTVANVQPPPEGAAVQLEVTDLSSASIDRALSSTDAPTLDEMPIEVETLLESVLEAALEPRPALAPTVHLTPFSPTPPIGVHVVTPPTLDSSPTMSERTDVRSAEAIARALERIAERVRRGELAVERDAASLSDGAALAMALAALLDHPRS